MTEIGRVPNWDIKLVEFAQSVRGASWVWGQTDCASIVRESLIRIYQSDLWNKEWNSVSSALKIIKKVGGVDKYLEKTGAREIDSSYVTTGDIHLSEDIDNGLPRFAMILPSSMVLISTEQTGVVIIRRRDLDDGIFWRYPEGVISGE